MAGRLGVTQSINASRCPAGTWIGPSPHAAITSTQGRSKHARRGNSTNGFSEPSDDAETSGPWRLAAHPHRSTYQEQLQPSLPHLWQTSGKHHPDQKFARYIARRIREGFWIGFDRSKCKPASATRNMLSTIQPVHKYLNTELEAR